MTLKILVIIMTKEGNYDLSVGTKNSLAMRRAQQHSCFLVVQVIVCQKILLTLTFNINIACSQSNHSHRPGVFEVVWGPQ